MEFYILLSRLFLLLWKLRPFIYCRVCHSLFSVLYGECFSATVLLLPLTNSFAFVFLLSECCRWRALNMQKQKSEIDLKQERRSLISISAVRLPTVCSNLFKRNTFCHRNTTFSPTFNCRRLQQLLRECVFV